MPIGVAISRMVSGSARPSAHSRREFTPRSEARASSGTRSSLAAVSNRISSASATSTSDSTAGAIGAAGGGLLRLHLVDHGAEVVGAVVGERAALDLDGLVVGEGRGRPRGHAELGRGDVGGHVEEGVDAHRPLAHGLDRVRAW